MTILNIIRATTRVSFLHRPARSAGGCDVCSLFVVNITAGMLVRSDFVLVLSGTTRQQNAKQDHCAKEGHIFSKERYSPAGRVVCTTFEAVERKEKGRS